MRKGFDAGVDAGGIRNSYEVNILVCYILKLKLDFVNKESKKPDRNHAFITYDEISDMLLKENLVNYFELNNSISELVSLNQIEQTENENAYFITEKGEENLDVLLLELPKTIREKIAGKYSILEAQKKVLKKNTATIKKVHDGFIVTLEILDFGSNLLTVDIFSPDEISAKLMQKSFLNNPKLLYQSVLSTLTGDVENLLLVLKNNPDDLF